METTGRRHVQHDRCTDVGFSVLLQASVRGLGVAAASGLGFRLVL